MRPVITLTTDFGLRDPFVGIMKGVILSIAPEAAIVDITHEIEPRNLVQAALALESAHAWFPRNTVHVVVVDPGVGGKRRALAVCAGPHIFVAPDNGTLTPILGPSARCFELSRKKYFLEPVSATFHGRDIFAPAAAWIAKGTPPGRMGKEIPDPWILEIPQARLQDRTIRGEVLHADRFGNLMTNISADLIERLVPPGGDVTLRIGGRTINGISSNYSQAKMGQLGMVVNSWNRLEIFCREADAAAKTGCGTGTSVTLRLQPGSSGGIKS